MASHCTQIAAAAARNSELVDNSTPGGGDRTRTCTSVRTQEPKSCVSTSSTTPARHLEYATAAHHRSHGAGTHYAASNFRSRRNLATCPVAFTLRSEEHTSELQSRGHLVCRLLLEKTN